jgi:hypothetical protein
VILKFAFDIPDTDVKPQLAYLGVMHYRDTGARKLGVGSPEESLLIYVLRRTVFEDSAFTSRKQAGYAGGVVRTLERQRLSPYFRSLARP